MTGSIRTIAIERAANAGRTPASDRVAVEEPLEIQLVSATAASAAARSISITMRTPGNDEELALGFLLTEGVIRSADQVVAVSPAGQATDESGLRNIIRVEIAADAEPDLERLARHFYTTSSCGVCGKASLEALQVSGLSSLQDETTRFPSAILSGLAGAVRQLQPVFAETGGLHAAAVFAANGDIVVVREDVGRHNATDKVIGALLRAGRLPGHGHGLFVSGRASFELAQKALVAGIPLLAAVGAPSSLAVDMAREFGMTLVGFLRGDTFNIYAGGERVN